MNFPRTFSDARGTVTVLDFQWAFWGNTACCMAHVRGAPELWFDFEAVEIYQMEEHADGTWTAWYHSTDPFLIANRDELVRLGGWE
jgi:hypothetical protein